MTSLRVLLLAGILMASAAGAAAQAVVSGRVTDKQTGEPLARFMSSGVVDWEQQRMPRVHFPFQQERAPLRLTSALLDTGHGQRP